VTDELADWPEKDERTREWVSPGEAALRVQETDLIAFMLTLSVLVAGSPDIA